MWGLLVKFIDDAIKGSEETIENSAPKKSNDDLCTFLSFCKVAKVDKKNDIVVNKSGKYFLSTENHHQYAACKKISKKRNPKSIIA